MTKVLAFLRGYRKLLQGEMKRSACRPLLCCVIAFCCAMCNGGCSDPVTRHSILSTLFDGVPALPSVEKLCEENLGDKYREYYDALAAAKENEKVSLENQGKREVLSRHRPFAEKNCSGCHDFKKTNRLITEKNELCFVCHKNFIKGKFVHGPVAVGDCLACHLPHDSFNTALLLEPRNTICTKCHREERLAAKMHENVIDHKMYCVDCHDPHSSRAQYFLK